MVTFELCPLQNWTLELISCPEKTDKGKFILSTKVNIWLNRICKKRRFKSLLTSEQKRNFQMIAENLLSFLQKNRGWILNGDLIDQSESAILYPSVVIYR